MSDETTTREETGEPVSFFDDELKEEILTQLSSSITGELIKVELIHEDRAAVNIREKRIIIPDTVENERREEQDESIAWLIQKALSCHEDSHVLFSEEIPQSVINAEATEILRAIEDPRVENLFVVFYPQARRYFKAAALFYTEKLREQPISELLNALCMSLDENLRGKFTVTPELQPLLNKCLEVCEKNDVLNNNFENCCNTAIEIKKLISDIQNPSEEEEKQNERIEEEIEKLIERREAIREDLQHAATSKEQRETTKKFYELNDLINKKSAEITNSEEDYSLTRDYTPRLPEEADTEDGEFNGKFSHATAEDMKEERKRFETRQQLQTNSSGNPDEEETLYPINKEDLIIPLPLCFANDDHLSKDVDTAAAVRDGREAAYKLRETLKLKRAARHNRDSGSLSMKLLKKQLRKRGKVYSPRLFKSNEKLQKDHSVMVLCDYSGSMNNSRKLPVAKEALISIAAMLRELKVNFSLRAFSSSQRNNETQDLILKDFKEELTDKRLEEITAKYSSYGSNKDGAAIKHATDLLSQQRGAKILIVISDGRPSAHAYEGKAADEHVREVIRRAEKKGIKVIGIGIDDGAETVPKLYKKHVIIKELQQLKRGLIKAYQKAAKELNV
jgi:hypothetical protein